MVGPGGGAPGKEARPVLLGWAALTAATVLARLLRPGESGSSAAVGDGAVACIALLGLVKCRLITPAGRRRRTPLRDPV